METLVFSIIIPTCDRNDLLAKCLNQLTPAGQNFSSEKFEIIVSDDSKNGVAKAFVDESYPKVFWTMGPRLGPASNRNNGAKHAQGNWLIFLDDDCVPNLDLLNHYSGFIESDPTIDVVEGAILPDGLSTSPLEYAPVNMEGGHLWSCNFAIKRTAFLSINGFDEYFRYPHMEDIDLRERLKARGFVIRFAASAAVVHPWRKLNDGKKLGRYQEMYIYYHMKHRKSFSYPKLAISIIRVHVALLRKSILSKEVFTAVKIMFDHVYTVTINYRKWKAKSGKILIQNTAQ